jgi:alkanesulfonate monooxygenase SsuD/methylene tetrahydromethanopterin reductase-like flavin-dependent oxidoreductase (luciferase family)
VRLALWPTLRQEWPEVRDVALVADGAGWDRLYLADHFMGDGVIDPAEVPTLEVTAALAALAAATDGIGLGTLVLGNTYRHPAVVANWVVTVDRVSGGRAVLGLGAGWQANEHAQYGIDLPPPGVRIRRLAEACEVITGLLRSPPVTFDGESYRLDAAPCQPGPVGPLPLLIGGRGDRMLGVVARWADEWNLWADAARFVERRAVLHAHCERIGRDPAAIATSAQALVLLTDDDAEARAFVERNAARVSVAGTPGRITDFIGALAGAGLDEFVVPDTYLGRGPAREEALAVLQEAAAGAGWTPRRRAQAAPG